MGAPTITPLARRDLPAASRVIADAWSGAAVVAEEKLLASGVNAPAEAWSARAGDEVIGVITVSGSWLRVIAVASSARGCGVGEALLARAIERVSDGGHEVIRIAAQPGNYLTPGVPADDPGAIAWLEKRGFVRTGENINLLVDVANNPRVSDARARELAAAVSGYRIERARSSDADVLALAGSFGPAWRHEVARALEAAPGGVHVARDGSGAPVAFAAHDGNNRGLGWFGPAGTIEAHRGRGLGAALLLPCLVDVAAAGHDRATIAWIGPRGFYERVVGVAGERRFVTMEKRLENP